MKLEKKPIKKSSKNSLLKAAKEMAKGLYEAGVIDKTTLRELWSKATKNCIEKT